MQSRQDLIPVGNPVGRSGARLSPQGLVLHSTAAPGAPAANVVAYFKQLQSPNRANAHIVVDWTEAVACVPWEPGRAEVAWHAGPAANSRFLGMELCESKDRTQALAAYRNWVQMAATILRAYGWPADEQHVWTHHRVSLTWHETDHVDPDPYLQSLGITWDQVLNDIRAAMAPAAAPAPAPVRQEVGGVAGFPDVRPTDWFAGAVERLHQAGIIQGAQDGLFHPQQPITRAEVAALMDRLIQYLRGQKPA